MYMLDPPPPFFRLLVNGGKVCSALLHSMHLPETPLWAPVFQGWLPVELE